MSMADWRLQGVEFVSCNCDWGCPCQFSALPSQGFCQAVVGMQVEHGHYNETRLDDLRWISLFAWPGPIHEGNGSCQVFVDDQASPAQREGLLKILSGQDTDPGATVFQVFASTVTQMHEPQFVPIEMHIDLPQRQAHFSIPGVLEAIGEPIRNPVSGAPQSIQLRLPDGFEFTEAEMASGSYQTQGAIRIASQNSHGHFARLHFTGRGVVR
ncbi:DUF1326 domain-containing protein [Pseudomonas sp. N040]|uniref:DUF1326 domain-containing protein n=1 Tax=Pseudomonas sp. N040 TaxID=2785325 RepID=UPI0018A2C81B|nr:DUF1326 domain-containing protein [Pseudomonas sp. N040]MBF7731242.1 DUF1326 domain-containing protein [Pseudomonas sp. N040]MBW7014885.1 DUF1326 domain-containing protein [Pseudomonas sp. N040]